MGPPRPGPRATPKGRFAGRAKGFLMSPALSPWCHRRPAPQLPASGQPWPLGRAAFVSPLPVPLAGGEAASPHRAFARPGPQAVPACRSKLGGSRPDGCLDRPGLPPGPRARASAPPTKPAPAEPGPQAALARSAGPAWRPPQPLVGGWASAPPGTRPPGRKRPGSRPRPGGSPPAGALP